MQTALRLGAQMARHAAMLVAQTLLLAGCVTLRPRVLLQPRILRLLMGKGQELVKLVLTPTTRQQIEACATSATTTRPCREQACGAEMGLLACRAMADLGALSRLCSMTSQACFVAATATMALAVPMAAAAAAGHQAAGMR